MPKRLVEENRSARQVRRRGRREASSDATSQPTASVLMAMGSAQKLVQAVSCKLAAVPDLRHGQLCVPYSHFDGENSKEQLFVVEICVSKFLESQKFLYLSGIESNVNFQTSSIPTQYKHSYER